MRLSLQVILAVAVLLSSYAPGDCQDDAARASLEADLRTDNILDVRVSLTFRAQKTYSFSIDLGAIESVEGIQVESIRSTPSTKVAFSLARQGQVLTVSWNSVYAGDVQEFRLSYRLVGVVTREAGNDVLFWRVICRTPKCGYAEVRATLRLPAGVEADRLMTNLHGGAHALGYHGEGNAIKVWTERLPAQSSLSVEVQLPSGLVNHGFLPNKFMKTTGGNILMFLLPALVLCGLFAMFWLRGRDPAIEAPSGVVARPSEGMTPEVAGAVVDERVEVRDIVGGVLDLAAGGFLKLRLIPGRGDQQDEMRVRAEKALDPLPEYRRRIAKLVAGEKEGNTLSASGSLPRADVAGIRKSIYEEATGRGFFRANPARERLTYGFIGALVAAFGALQVTYSSGSLAIALQGLPFIVASVLVAACVVVSEGRVLRVVFGLAAAVLLFVGIVVVTSHVGEGGMPWLAKLGWGLIFSSLFFFVFAPFMPQRTAEGAAERARAFAMMEYIRELEPAKGDAGRLQTEFETLLPYAVALRLKKEWINKFANAGVLAPAWWETGSPKSEGAVEGERRTLAEVRQEFVETLTLLSTALGESPEAGSGW
ncbi:MAG: DUF2207 domain-containing protein [Planctomycetota bacterium]|nr:DUF2207 domain-containing protein [Planctomycetota bacterium]